MKFKSEMFGRDIDFDEWTWRILNECNSAFKYIIDSNLDEPVMGAIYNVHEIIDEYLKVAHSESSNEGYQLVKKCFNLTDQDYYWDSKFETKYKDIIAAVEKYDETKRHLYDETKGHLSNNRNDFIKNENKNMNEDISSGSDAQNLFNSIPHVAGQPFEVSDLLVAPKTKRFIANHLTNPNEGKEEFKGNVIAAIAKNAEDNENKTAFLEYIKKANLSKNALFQLLKRGKVPLVKKPKLLHKLLPQEILDNIRKTNAERTHSGKRIYTVFNMYKDNKFEVDKNARILDFDGFKQYLYDLMLKTEVSDINQTSTLLRAKYHKNESIDKIKNKKQVDEVDYERPTRPLHSYKSDLAVKYFLMVSDSESVNNYSQFVTQNLELTDDASNKSYSHCFKTID